MHGSLRSLGCSRRAHGFVCVSVGATMIHQLAADSRYHCGTLRKGRVYHNFCQPNVGRQMSCTPIENEHIACAGTTCCVVLGCPISFVVSNWLLIVCTHSAKWIFNSFFWNELLWGRGACVHANIHSGNSVATLCDSCTHDSHDSMGFMNAKFLRITCTANVHSLIVTADSTCELKYHHISPSILKMLKI